MSMGNPQIQCFGRMPVDGFFPDFFRDFLRAQNMVRVIEGKRKLVRVSGSSSYRGFELPKVKLQ